MTALETWAFFASILMLILAFYNLMKGIGHLIELKQIERRWDAEFQQILKNNAIIMRDVRIVSNDRRME